ncbi:efflux RND transporter periplasmic adaptor subunit [Oricola cellulosilytica]|uniref:Efflux RND transporter periplasmic adaptor subunit n=1 Tax=Oricola cellulosilytica TaxID=1429082 RepID=A0A4R0PGB7_9HYPH|nr:efflux RND transporter periplasmic adaptor subunit [Oricola cellulosilytica]TCD15963.1 efflux RND transporter periplasmic adaptor subunit [Oricola cellulosilytica]
MKANRYVAILVFLGSAAWIATGEFSFVGSAIGNEEEKPVEVTATAEQADDALAIVGTAVIPQVEHARSVKVSGVTRADKETVLTSRTGGVIGELNVEQGDAVKKGDVIARIAPEGRDAAVRTAEQQLEQAKAEADARLRLVERGTLPKLQADAAVSALRAAESQVEAAKAELERLEVVVPYDGVIDVLQIEEGASVNGGTPVATLIALDPIVGIGEVNEGDLGVVEVGDDAQLRLVTGETVAGKVRYVSRVAQKTTRTFTVEVEVPNPDLVIPAGMTAEVILRGRPVLATPVPRSVIALNDDGELGIRSVDDRDRVVFHPIDIVDDSTSALILGGIPKGARVIVAGQNFVADGEKVKAVESDRETIERLIEEARTGAL